MQQFVQFFRFGAHNCGFFVNQAFLQHIHCNLNHSRAGAFAVSCLQEPEFSVLNCKLEVLHIFVMLFEFILNFIKLFVNFRHIFFERRIFFASFFFGNTLRFRPFNRTFFRNLLRRSDTGYNVLALRVNQIFAVENIFAGCRVARKCNAGCGIVAHVAEYHCLHVYRGSPMRGNVVHLAIENCAFVVPTVKHSHNRSPKLLPRVCRKILLGSFFNYFFEPFYKLLQIFNRKFGVLFDSFFGFQFVDNFFERVVVFFVFRFHSHNHVAVHLDKSAVGIPSETRIICFFCEPFNNLVVQSQIQNRVHHSRHRCRRAGTNRNQKRIFSVAEF